jgi:hypothetical protein
MAEKYPKALDLNLMVNVKKKLSSSVRSSSRMIFFLILSLSSTGYILNAQELFLKQVKYMEEGMTEAFVQLTVEYDDSYSVTKVYEYNQQALVSTREFENDTLKRQVFDGHICNFIHFSDSIYAVNYYGNNDTLVLFCNSNYEICKSKNGSWEDIWENGNNTQNWVFGEPYTANTYNLMINPYSYLFKTYKAGIRGSGNQIVSTTYWEGGYSEWEVIESKMNYPLEIDEYYNSNYLATTYYEYVSSSDLTETKPGSLSVVTVQYFNIWGQLIPEPDAGIYIKRIIYNDGIKTSTHFK